MMQKILNSKNFVACLLAAATGMTLYFRVRFPEENVFLQVMALPAVAVNLLLRQILLHALPLLDPLHRLFDGALWRVHFYSQSRPSSSRGPLAPLSRPSQKGGTLPGTGGDSQSAKAGTRRKPAVARHPGKRGGLKGSTQHWPAVYPPECEIPRFAVAGY